VAGREEILGARFCQRRPPRLVGNGACSTVHSNLQNLRSRLSAQSHSDPFAALRRALSDGHGGNRYLVNIPGRGYRFVAAVTVAEQLGPAPTQIPPARRGHNLPALLTRLVGRAEVVSNLVEQLSRQRFLSI